nr:MAG TPA: hypothetical protein [Bacteriophage sp.]
MEIPLRSVIFFILSNAVISKLLKALQTYFYSKD